MRLLQVRNAVGLAQKAQMADMLGMGRNTYGRYEDGERYPTFRALEALHRVFPQVNVPWLLCGQGEMVERVADPPPGIIIWAEDRAAVEAMEGKDVYQAVPFMEDAAAAGAARVMKDEIAGYVLIHEAVAPDPKRLRCIRVAGASMEPTLTDGSIVAVDVTRKDPKAAEGRIVCARTEDGVVFKRWRTTGRHVVLASDNPGFPSVVLEPDEVDAGALIGTVIWAWVDLR